MPKKSPTPSFVCEIPLKISPANEGILLSRFEAARQMYNACLGEAMRRIRLIRQSRDFNKARSLKSNNPERKVLFKRARERYDFSEYALHSYSTGLRQSWLGNHIDSNTAQKLATRAYKAAEKVLFGQAKKVRFKGANQMDSVEGKSNKSGIRWKGETVEWGGLELPALIASNDPVILHGLQSKVKYVRLVRRKINGCNRFYAQLVCQGKPFIKPKNYLGHGDVGIDIGPSTIAVVSDTDVKLQQFASELEFDAAHIEWLQRKMDRSRRATNPGNYNPNGTVKKGKKKWNNSKTYLKTRNSKANKERKLAAHRKSLHGELVNTILRTGDTIKFEKLSYKAFQKLFGKSVGKRAPSMFISHLISKAERAGSQVIEIPTYSTKLSQTCHCGRVKKKNLSERIHDCECGIIAQRDLYSAFLAKHIEPDTFVLQVSQLLVDWQSVELRLQAAWRTATECNQPATRRIRPSSFGRCPKVEQVAAKVLTQVPKSQDVVGDTLSISTRLRRERGS
ncbi:transposase [Coleofasciculus sp. LEGE 07092]|uniref:RNA-guided endonuclease TnpB family protein n=1 Tax=Coleofasciculus sp. LEGE 07081 TaxID=2777967 RepID=UPI00187F0045|nr:RNA-guided endonuclease TnpB family protein [Coleofasciculus sp. LEGE 07081]MBE9148238.1 transposase [Coleofasciculus sp. LEGE 07092]